jgi:excisionase family DNA binding protein
MSAGTITVTATIADTEIEAIERRIEQRLREQLEIQPSSAWMSVDKAAAHLDWPKKRLYNLVAAKEIPHRKHGNRLLFRRDELDQWLDYYYEEPTRFGP